MIAETLRILREHGVELAAPLSEPELIFVEETYGFRFAPAHRALIATGLPIIHGWWDWRNENDATLRSIVNWPIDGILFDVAQNSFWPQSWGNRPSDPDRVAREHLRTWPTLVPLCGHRFMLAADANETVVVTDGQAPVFSVYQSDVVIYGHNLLDYAAREFGDAHGDGDAPEETAAGSANPWLRLAFGLDIR